MSQQRQLAQARLAEDRRIRIESVKREQDLKYEEEVRLRERKEQEVQQMEILEMELIKKLQNTQAI